LIGKDYETHKIKNQIKKYFEIKDVGDVDFIIGIKFQKYHNGYILHQKRYTLNILDKFKKYNIFPSMNLKPSENEININTNKKFNPTIYRSAIGNLLYLAISTRPDILFAVSKAARRSQNPTVDDWNKVIKIFNYLKGNTNYGLYFTKDKTIKAYSDADYAGDKDSRRSTSGFMITIGNSPISWSSKLQHCVSTSTAESEYYSLSECSKHCIWIKNMLNELHQNNKEINIYVDNRATIHMSKNVLINQKSKHIDIRYHHVRELIADKKIKLNHINSKYNLADGLTKYLNNKSLNNFKNRILIEFK